MTDDDRVAKLVRELETHITFGQGWRAGSDLRVEALERKLQAHIEFTRGWQKGTKERQRHLERAMNKLELTMHELNGIVGNLQLASDLAAKERRERGKNG